MAYTKQTWTCGDEITAEKLNHMEDGIENAGGGTDTLIIRVDRVEETTTYYDHTWQDVYDALEIGKRCVVIFPVSVEADENNPAVSGIETDEIWAAVIETQNNINNYTASGSGESNYRKYEADNANSPLKFAQPF